MSMDEKGDHTRRRGKKTNGIEEERRRRLVEREWWVVWGSPGMTIERERCWGEEGVRGRYRGVLHDKRTGSRA